MSFKEKYGNTELIRGGSEGMGAAYAQALAAQGMDLVLIARRKEPLEATALQIAGQFGVKVLTVVCDLTVADALEHIINDICDIPIDFLVYNAALSYIGPYLTTDIST